jgi:hypothetical protein
MTVKLYHAPVNAGNILPRRIERKYYLVPVKVGLAYGLLRHICLMDSEYPSEQINSLYFDTADLDQHERSSSGDFRKNKVRIRWYGENNSLHGMQTVFLELKSRWGFASAKQRRKLQVPAENLTPNRLGSGIVPGTLLSETLAGFGYFTAGWLQPVVKISYWRYRFREVMTGQGVALDCHVRSTMIIPGLGSGEKELELPGGVIEIKGQTMEIPAILRQMKMLDIDWTRFSKYSYCLDSHLSEPGTIARLWPSGRIAET